MAKKGNSNQRKKRPAQTGKKNQSASNNKRNTSSKSPQSKATTTKAPVAEAPVKSKRPVRKEVEKKPVVMPFGRMNYILLVIGIAIIGLGFYLMSLDEFIDAEEFSISLYIAPPITVLGFLEIIYAIMYKPKDQIETAQVETSEG